MPTKEWAWSYSKYKNYAVCPKRHYEVDIAKHFTDTSEALDWGNEVHHALAAAVKGEKPLPDTMKEYQHWVDEARTGIFSGDNLPLWGRHLLLPNCPVEIEQQYAITKDFQPTTWFGNDAWFRGIMDVGRFDPTKTVGIARDYKTGKIQHDSRQLMLMATCLFAHIPTLMRLRTEFIWIKDDCTTAETFDRKTIMQEWPPLLPQVAEMKAAATSLTYPPKPGKLCARYCPVVSCPYHGKRH